MSNYHILVKSFNKYDLFAENSRFYLLWADTGFFGGGVSEQGGGISFAAYVMRRAAKWFRLVAVMFVEEDAVRGKLMPLKC